MKLTKRISHIALFGLTIISLFPLYNCEEQPLEAGLDILPGELLEVVDTTLSVELYTINEDAILSRNLGISPLGVVNDSVIGILETEFITDFMYKDDVDYSEANEVELLDIKLYLDYQDTYGDSMDVNFNVYELLDPMPNYGYSDYQVFEHMYDHEALNVGEPYFHIDSARTALVVDFSEDFAYRIIEACRDTNGIGLVENQSQFKDVFKGFYFATEARQTEGGGILMINHSLATLELTVREQIIYSADSAVWDTTTSIFSLGNPSSTVDDGGVHLNLYNTTMAPAVEAAYNNFGVVGKRAYINALSGPQVLARIPGLEALREEYEGQISVNFAHLMVPFDSEVYLRDDNFYKAPDQLGIYDAGSNEALLDDILAENHLGGKLDTVDYQYQFNIGNHLHSYLREIDSEYSNSFNMFAASGSPAIKFRNTPARVVLQQDSSINRYPKVRIVYSVIPK